jgi:hypothetical protein
MTHQYRFRCQTPEELSHLSSFMLNIIIIVFTLILVKIIMSIHHLISVIFFWGGGCDPLVQRKL